MLRAEFAFRGSAFGSWTALAIVTACSVYDASLLTGGSGRGEGSGGNGGTSPSGGASGSDAGQPSGGTAGAGAMTGGASGMSGNEGSGGGRGGAGGLPATGGTDGGEGGEGATGGSSGGVGGGGSGGSPATGGNGGNGGNCGVCGCDMPETDADGDGVPDCNDICIGFDDAHCTVLRSALRNRYSFTDTGTTVTDSRGASSGAAVNATLGGMGTLTLSGGNTSSPPYVNLPNGLISSLTNATFELWLTWSQSGTNGQNWQRIFDFGTSGTEDMQTTNGSSTMSYLFLTPLAGTTPQGIRASYSTTGTSGETSVGTATPLPAGTAQHVALVIDDANDQMALYLNGTLQQATPFAGALADISDVNNWLARSQWSGDYEFIGTFDEFRIYGAALSAAQISTSRGIGPNAAFLD